jgi:hypothetical protein
MPAVAGQVVAHKGQTEQAGMAELACDRVRFFPTLPRGSRRRGTMNSCHRHRADSPREVVSRPQSRRPSVDPRR